MLYIFIKIRDGLSFDSSHPNKFDANKRLFELRKLGKQAKAFTQEEIMEMQQQSRQSQPTQRNETIQQPIQRPKHKRGIVRMPHKQPAITVGMNHIQKRRR